VTKRDEFIPCSSRQARRLGTIARDNHDVGSNHWRLGGRGDNFGGRGDDFGGRGDVGVTVVAGTAMVLSLPTEFGGPALATPASALIAATMR
jgi:hypothetical protein